MDMSNLPVSNQADIDAASAAAKVAETVARDAVTAAETEAEKSNIAQRVANALARIGIDPTMIEGFLVARLEAAASAYENAQIPSYKDFWHAEAVRLTAALHAL